MGLTHSMSKMYKSSSDNEKPQIVPNLNNTPEKRIAALESKVALLDNQVSKLLTILEQERKTVRKQNATINNLSTAIRNK